MEKSALERQVMTKVTWRLLPFMCVCYLAAFIDRVNVSFAKLSMLSDLNLSTAIYGFGAGIFFVGYFLFEVPSNLLMERVGARLWIARIMLVWAVISAAMMFVKGKWMFYSLRFLLGAAEAGFFPGMILYNTYWFPKAYRSRTISIFMAAAVFSFVIGSPLSGWLLDHPRLGLRNWQWLFLIEGIPSFLLGIVVLFYLPDGPRRARWMKPDELAWLTSVLDAERAQQERKKHFTLWEALVNPKVLLLSLIYFLNVVSGYGLDFFAPTILQSAYPSLSKLELGWLNALPPLITIPIMVIHGRLSDRMKEQRWHVALAAWWFAVGLVMLSFRLSPAMVLVAMTVCVSGRWSVIGPFWGLPTAFLTGTAAAGGIALINSLGNLGGQAGPVILSWCQSPDGSFSLGLRVLAVLVVLCGVLTLSLRVPRPDAQPAAGALLETSKTT
jgi:ACS family tartrate transporter-like MFS transporter